MSHFSCCSRQHPKTVLLGLLICCPPMVEMGQFVALPQKKWDSLLPSHGRNGTVYYLPMVEMGQFAALPCWNGTVCCLPMLKWDSLLTSHGQMVQFVTFPWYKWGSWLTTHGINGTFVLQWYKWDNLLLSFGRNGPVSYLSMVEMGQLVGALSVPAIRHRVVTRKNMHRELAL